MNSRRCDDGALPAATATLLSNSAQGPARDAATRFLGYGDALDGVEATDGLGTIRSGTYLTQP